MALWLLVSRRRGEAWIGAACLLAAAHWIANALPNIVLRYAGSGTRSLFGRSTGFGRMAAARRMG